MTPLRVPWPADFPRVVLHTTVKIRDAHPDYAAAKSGDAEAAVRLADALYRPDQLNALVRFLSGHRSAVLLPVHAEEQAGFNAIPLGMSQLLASVSGLRIDDGIVQINKVAHTRADGFARLARPALFGGKVIKDAQYLVIDDHFGMGGTIANLRGFVVAHGATVIGATALTASRANDIIALHPDTLRRMHAQFGLGLDDYFKQAHGFGQDCLTQPEAEYLLRVADVDAVRSRISAAQDC